MSHILIVDDEKTIRQALKDILEDESYEVSEAPDGEAAWALLEEQTFDAVLCDIKMPKMDGVELLSKAMESGMDVPFIMISAHGTIETAVDATKKGAFDFIQKPPDLNRLLLTVRNALSNSTLQTETKRLKKKINSRYDIVGESAGIVEIKETIEKVAPTEARVLITGENGTGKELVARWLHEKSHRSASPMIEVNCAAIPSELIESELFGHEKGSFTSAHKQRSGKFEQAQGGTLFLDEIGDMSLSAQAKVLRALQENQITRVGGDKNIKVDVRVLAATNKDLRKEIEAGRFREDLYHRLSVMIIHVPALRDRSDDIPLLVDHFLNQVSQEYGTAPKKITSEAIELLQKYKWTGNIRELRNIVERLIIMSNAQITKEDVIKYVEI
ncbi:sigma-54 dependent transcriptional regulator [Marinoscillum sp. 108]|jgi:DNA-binding NtrC family response regulator|uniref:sigma-54-dependent transcriptional regulator n=1 Tax=Marinoscillum sp. 108 TaxID=2653151 RepID=UPI0012F1BD60|nr:sigma-54 dependent transcriptional regulator [Marinoscillum sp. 108]VXD16422.1 Transcriptional regulatory protein ZraR [Marinoscillum sp. 108]